MPLGNATNTTAAATPVKSRCRQEEEEMAVSPPQRLSSAIAMRLLFGDEEMIGEAVSTTTPTPAAFLPLSHHKRSNRSHVTDDDNIDDMLLVSPHPLSPSLFKTLDGRTVSSNNPFSPKLQAASDSSNNNIMTHHHHPRPVPAFPMTLSATPSWDESVKHPEPPRLERRDCPSDLLHHHHQSPHHRQHHLSPRKSTDDIAASTSSLFNASKIRRLTLETNDVGKGQPSEHPSRRWDFDDDDDDDIMADDDRVSPTDVTQFARLHPPATPAKAPRPRFSQAIAATPFRPAKPYNTTNYHSNYSHPPPLTPHLVRRSMARHAVTATYSSSGSVCSDKTPSLFFGENGASPDSPSSLPTDDDEDVALAEADPVSRFSQDFDVLEVLGQGSFGTVYKCLSRLDGCLYAIKTALRPAKGHADRQRMFQEVYALAALSDHADPAAFHIVRYHQAWMEADNRLYIQTELCTSTLLQEINDELYYLTESRRFKLLREMCLALDFCHRHGMVHLDIKPDNIFIKNDQYKLGDFGLVSRRKTKRQQQGKENDNTGDANSYSNFGGDNDNVDDGDDDTMVEEGDSRYMSRELLVGDWNDLTKCDVFSLGATVYQVCMGRPLPGDGPEWHAIRSGDLSFAAGAAATTANTTTTPFEMSLMIREMMHPDPSMRPPAAKLLERRQLLSEERKALIAEQDKVRQATLALAETRRKLGGNNNNNNNKWPAPLRSNPTAKGLSRASTWTGI